MALKLLKKPKLLNEFIEICKRNEYFAAFASNNLIKDIQFLKHSTNLKVNIERQWLLKSEDNKNSLKTYSNADFTLDYGDNLTLLDKYSIIRKRDRLSRTTPFGLIEILNGKRTIRNETDESAVEIQMNDDEKHLTCSYLVSDKQSREYFYRIQRMRKIWWMKYAANPGRFHISETTLDENTDSTSVLIKANFPFGNVDIEKIELVPLSAITTQYDSISKHLASTKVVKTTTTSEVATIEIVFDAIDAGDFGEMCLHRKIAPYQIGLYILNKDASIANDLEDLEKYIKLLLEKSNISVFNLKEHTFCDKTALELKYIEMDAIGIPYGIILNEESLRTGLMKLRNRDTTLSETIHISYLNDYLPKIFQNS